MHIGTDITPSPPPPPPGGGGGGQTGEQGCGHDQLRPPARGPNPNWVVFTFINSSY